MHPSEIQPPAAPNVPDPAQWVERYGDMLFGYALGRVPDRGVAEDLVQETFLAALDGLATYAGRSQFATWLVAILRRKIIDHYRRQVREPSTGQPSDADFDTLCFDRRGKWRGTQRRWPTSPDEALLAEEFETMLADCIAHLPLSLAAAFVLREREQLTIDEISESLALSPTNVSVRLHRARLQLRQCIDRKWTGPVETSGGRGSR